MAKTTKEKNKWAVNPRKSKTSIGKSKNSRPTNKSKKRNWKKYNRQGKR